MSDLQTAIQAYTELERKVDTVWAPLSQKVCGRCEKVCCKPVVCREAVESDWLRLVSEREYGEWVPADVEDRWESECMALRADGCLLAVGRPAICRGYYCPDVLDACSDIYEVIFYTFSAEIPWVVSKLTRRTDLITLERERLEQYAGRILRAVRRADQLFELSKTLLDEQAAKETKLKIALTLVCANSRFLKQGVKDRILEELAAEGLSLPEDV
ncbi:MAG: hypothetical protein ACLFVU_13870 [Phycisphaerae bacterium]